MRTMRRCPVPKVASRAAVCGYEIYVEFSVLFRVFKKETQRGVVLAVTKRRHKHRRVIWALDQGGNSGLIPRGRCRIGAIAALKKRQVSLVKSKLWGTSVRGLSTYMRRFCIEPRDTDGALFVYDRATDEQLMVYLP